jgi:hypothetical protein
MARPEQITAAAKAKGAFGLAADALTLCVGAALIVVLVFTMQWIDQRTVGNSAETDVPNPIGVGVLLGLVVINSLAYLAAWRRLLPPRTLLVLYVMLTISLPLCNTAFVGPFYASLTGVQGEHLDRRIPTIEPAYGRFQTKAYFPKLPQKEYEEFWRLGDAAYAKAAGVKDPAARRTEILNPMKRFWHGKNITPRIKQQYENPSWTFWDRLSASAEAIPWSIWRSPVLRWGAFFLVLLLGLLCVGQVLYRDWTERENLPFPVAQLPLAMIGGGEGAEDARRQRIFSSPFFWGAAAVGALLLLLGGLAHYDHLQISPTSAVTFQRINFERILVREPWSILKRNLLVFSPLMLGLALLVHKDVLRGVVVIFLGLLGLRFVVGLFETEISETLGWAWQGNRMPYYPELGTGSAVVFALVMIWRSRRALSWRRGASPPPAGGRSYLPPRIAGIGLAVALVGVAVWWYLVGAEGPAGLFVAAAVILFVFIAGVALARCRAEGGLPGSTAPVTNEIAVSLKTGGVGTHGFANLMALSHTWFLAASALPGVVATQIESLYLGRRLKVSARLIAAAVVVGFAVAVGAGLLSFLVMAYWHGSQHLLESLDRAKYPYWFYYFCTGDPTVDKFPVDWVWVSMVAAGAVFMAVLLLLRKRFPRFPIPPISLLIVCLGTYTMVRDNSRTGQYAGLHQRFPICFIWGPMLIALMIKSLVLRFGGMDLYVRIIPAALGLVFAHAVMIVVWNVYHLVVVGSGGMPVFTGVFQ